MEKLYALELLIREHLQKRKRGGAGGEQSTRLQSAISETQESIRKSFGQKKTGPAKLRKKDLRFTAS